MDGVTALQSAVYNKAPYDLMKKLATEPPVVLRITDNNIPLHIALRT
jgi:hypothetical protein